MSIVEFIEAISRVADRVDIPHLLLAEIPKQEIIKELCIKIEAYLLLLVEKVLGH